MTQTKTTEQITYTYYGIFSKRELRTIYVGRTQKDLIDRVAMYHTYVRQGTSKRPIADHLREHGIENFEFHVLEKSTDPSREKDWIEWYNTFRNGYNSTQNGLFAREWTEEEREIMRDQMSQLIWVSKGDQTKRVSEEDLPQHLEDGWTYGRPDWTDWVRKARWLYKGDVTTRVAADKVDELLEEGWQFGRATPSRTKPCVINGRQFVSRAEAARFFGVHQQTVADWIRNGKPGCVDGEQGAA